MSVADVDKIAQGRVWVGEVAHELGLVDSLGGLETAIDEAAAHAEHEHRIETFCFSGVIVLPKG